MIAQLERLEGRKGFLKNELRSMGITSHELNEEDLADMLEFAKHEQYDNYKKAYPSRQ